MVNERVQRREDKDRKSFEGGGRVIGVGVKSDGVMHRVTFIDKIFCNLYGFTLYYSYL